MVLPAGIQLSQGSLQDYVDCARRFQLRYVRRLQWPATEAEPALENERHLRQGAAFHRLIRQHLLGIPGDALLSTVSAPELRRWLRSYLRHGPTGLPAERHPEVVLSTSIGGRRLVARYDLIAVDEDGRALIFDWKTNRVRPRREWLAQRLQTRVYPHVLVSAGGALGDRDPPEAAQVSMVYWFANFPLEPEVFSYDAGCYQEDERYLLGLIEEIEETMADCPDHELLPRTDDESRCRVCRYRSLCRRGVEPGWREARGGETSDADLLGFDLEFEQIAELELG